WITGQRDGKRLTWERGGIIFSPTGVAAEFALWITGQRDGNRLTWGRGGIIFSPTGVAGRLALWITGQRDGEPGGMAETGIGLCALAVGRYVRAVTVECDLRGRARVAVGLRKGRSRSPGKGHGCPNGE